MGLVILEAVGPRGEQLAERAGERIDAATGFDPEFDSITFDSETLDDEGLRAALFEALDALDPGWREHLRPVE